MVKFTDIIVHGELRPKGYKQFDKQTANGGGPSLFFGEASLTNIISMVNNEHQW